MGHFKGVGGSGRAHLKPVARLEAFYVKGHVGVLRAIKVFGKCFNGIIVGCENTRGARSVDFLQKDSSQSCAKVRVRTGTKFVDQNQGGGVAPGEYFAHFGQLAAVGRQFVFYRLRVADVCHDALEPAHGGSGVGRNQESALQHELKKSDCFKGKRLASRVGARD